MSFSRTDKNNTVYMVGLPRSKRAESPSPLAPASKASLPEGFAHAHVVPGTVYCIVFTADKGRVYRFYSLPIQSMIGNYCDTPWILVFVCDVIGGEEYYYLWENGSCKGMYRYQRQWPNSCTMLMCTCHATTLCRNNGHEEPIFQNTRAFSLILPWMFLITL